MIISRLTLLLYFCLLYIICLSIIYFSKDRINNIENRIYKWLLCTNILGIVLQLLCDYVSAYNSIIPSIISSIIFKSFLVYFILFINIILLYLLAISYNDNKNILNANILLTIIEFIIVLFLPYKLFADPVNHIFYTYGAAINYVFVLSAIIMIAMGVIITFNAKKINKKKILPILLLIFFGTISAFIQKNSPDIIIIAPMESFICFLMYFTIENPDVKMIEQLNEAKDAADKANNAKSEFLSSMSHEIRTPLNAIVGFSNGLVDNDKLDNESKEDVKNIIMASDALLELVNGILDISKIEAGKLEIIDTYYSFPKIFDELVLLTKARLGEKPLEFNYTYDKSIPEYLYGDATRVKQVILNLLTNSVKYTNTGFVDFKIHSIVKGDVIRLIVSVEDSGIGIKKENIDKLFGRFERLGVEKDTTVEGTGLGLAITKKLVEMMGGKIVVQSVYGKGSLFTISLDQKIVTGSELEKLKKEESSKEESTSLIDASNKKVLVVDDNNLNLKVAERLLSAYKCDVECVGSGFECIERIVNGEKYDLILLDDMMPKMSGKETFDKLKEVPEFNIPVVALTANAISGMKEEYLKYGFNDYLSKPIEKDELNRVMKKYLK